MSNKLRLAIPTVQPGGMDAGRSDHFGHCELFTLVEIIDNNVTGVETIGNPSHGSGGCMVPVQSLKDNGVDAIIVGGIGAKPLQGFYQAKIAVYFADISSAPTVKSVVNGMLAGSFPLIRDDQTCKGGSHCNH